MKLKKPTPPPMEFVNFWNAETYYIFQLVAQAKDIDLDAMISEAFEDPEAKKKENNVDFVATAEQIAEHALAHAVQGWVGDRFSELLKQLGKAPEHPKEHSEPIAKHEAFSLTLADWSFVYAYPADISELFLMIVGTRLDEVNYDSIARALLIRAGKGGAK